MTVTMEDIKTRKRFHRNLAMNGGTSCLECEILKDIIRPHQAAGEYFHIFSLEYYLLRDLGTYLGHGRDCFDEDVRDYMREINLYTLLLVMMPGSVYGFFVSCTPEQGETISKMVNERGGYLHFENRPPLFYYYGRPYYLFHVK